MAPALLHAIRDRLADELDEVTFDGDTLIGKADARYGEVAVRIDHDEDAESLRVSVAVAPPAGAGTEFLVFCLATNTQYWDVKLGLDDDGHVLVHADIELDEDPEPDDVATAVIDRSESILELLDDDLTEWLLQHELGTPAQIERWTSRPLEA